MEVVFGGSIREALCRGCRLSLLDRHCALTEGDGMILQLMDGRRKGMSWEVWLFVKRDLQMAAGVSQSTENPQAKGSSDLTD
jgi:predicted phage tail protein